MKDFLHIHDFFNIWNKVKVKYPENLKTKKSKIAYWFFKNWYYLTLGRGAIFGRWTTLVTDFAMILLLVDRFFSAFVKLNAFIVVMVFLVSIFLSWFGGCYYAALEFDRIETQVGQERNPLMNDMHKKIVKNKERDLF